MDIHNLGSYGIVLEYSIVEFFLLLAISDFVGNSKFTLIFPSMSDVL